MNNSTWSDQAVAYAILRFTIGVNMLMHGVARVGSAYHTFADGMVKSFEATFLPAWFVRAFAYMVVPVELGIGILLILGLRTRMAALMGGLLMSAFTFGQCLQQNWRAAGSILVYALVFFVVLFLQSHNLIAVDHLLSKKSNQ
ncbi:MAG: DoxX family membrane protein [Elusimicrobia bacterium]|nr:DoxX family membrane protein [Elusimicrobiota bacterium]MBD3411915.1 DoxX family membrane protein [Elusimicrobiota bacterium]